MHMDPGLLKGWINCLAHFFMEVSAKVSEAVPFANGFVCLELVVTGLNW